MVLQRNIARIWTQGSPGETLLQPRGIACSLLCLFLLCCQDGDGLYLGDVDASVGPCSGTPAECEAARVINEYRTTHRHKGECNNALKWNDHLGQLAHAHQNGPYVRHSDHGYLENVGQGFGVRETAIYIIQYEYGTEPHCKSDGSYRTSHHCAAMYCGNHTVGVGVYEQGGATYMTMMFGDEDGH